MSSVDPLSLLPSPHAKLYATIPSAPTSPATASCCRARVLDCASWFACEPMLSPSGIGAEIQGRVKGLNARLRAASPCVPTSPAPPASCRAPVLDCASRFAWESMLSPSGIGAEIQGRVEEVYDTLHSEAQQRSIQEASSSEARVSGPRAAAAAEQLNRLPDMLPVIGNGLMPVLDGVSDGETDCAVIGNGFKEAAVAPASAPADTAGAAAGTASSEIAVAGPAGLAVAAASTAAGTTATVAAGTPKATAATPEAAAAGSSSAERETKRLSLPESLSAETRGSTEGRRERERNAVGGGGGGMDTIGEEGRSDGVVKGPVREGMAKIGEVETEGNRASPHRKAARNGAPRKAEGSKQAVQRPAEPKKARKVDPEPERKREAVKKAVSVLERGSESRAAKDSPNLGVTVSAWDLGAKGSLAGLVMERGREVADGPCAIQLLLGGGTRGGVSPGANGCAVAAPAAPAAAAAVGGDNPTAAALLAGAGCSGTSLVATAAHTGAGASQQAPGANSSAGNHVETKRHGEKREGGLTGTKRRAEQDLSEREARVRKVGGDSGVDAISLLTRPGQGLMGATIPSGGSNIIGRDADGFRVPRALDAGRREGKIVTGSTDKGILGRAPLAHTGSGNDQATGNGGGFVGHDSKMLGEPKQGANEAVALQILQLHVKKA